MKNVILVSVLFLLFISGGCRERSYHYPPMMERAIGLTESNPERALACLDSFELSSPVLDEEARMYCHLLRIKAEDKLYVLHTSDTLINRIVRFYEGWGDDRRLAEAIYYLGGMYRDCNDPSRAIRTYLRAAEVGCEHDTLNGRIYGQLAALYAYQKAYKASLEALRKALIYNIKCKNGKGIAYSWRDMARIFNRQHHPDSAEVYYRKAYTFMKEKGFIPAAYGVLSEWADFKYENGSPEQAKNMAHEVLAYHFCSLSTLILAKSYLAENHPDSAEAYCRKTLQGNDIYHHTTAYAILKEIALAQGKQENAHRYDSCYQAVSDSINRMTRTETAVRISQEAEKLDLLSRMKKQSYMLASALTVLIAGAIYMLRHIRTSRKKRQPGKGPALEENPQASTPGQKQTLEERLEAFHQSAIYLHFCRVAQSRELSEENWRQLANALNQVYPTFIPRLYSLNPKLTELELRTCCLIKIEAPTNRISTLIAHSPSAVNSILTRLYHKMTGEKARMSVVREFLKHLE